LGEQCFIQLLELVVKLLVLVPSSLQFLLKDANGLVLLAEDLNLRSALSDLNVELIDGLLRMLKLLIAGV
jgi:hypothetical protein